MSERKPLLPSSADNRTHFNDAMRTRYKYIIINRILDFSPRRNIRNNEMIIIIIVQSRPMQYDRAGEIVFLEIGFSCAENVDFHACTTHNTCALNEDIDAIN